MRMLTFPSQATNRRLVVGDSHYYWLYDMPATEQEIELTVAGVIRRGTINIPPMRMMLRSSHGLSSDVVNYLFVIPPNGADNDVGLMPFTMANVDSKGAICYGNGNHYPQDPFDAWTNFWQSTFNDHLMNHVNYLNDNHIRMYVEEKKLVSVADVENNKQIRNTLERSLGVLVMQKTKLEEDLSVPVTKIETDINERHECAEQHCLHLERMVQEYSAAIQQMDRYRGVVALRKKEYLVVQYNAAIKRRRIYERRKELANNFMEDMIRALTRRFVVDGIRCDEKNKLSINRSVFLAMFNAYADSSGYSKLREYKQIRSVTFWRIVHRCIVFVIMNEIHEIHSKIERMVNPTLDYITKNGGTRGLAEPFVDWWFLQGGWQTKLKRLEAPPISPATVRHTFNLDKYKTRSFLFLRARPYSMVDGSPPAHTVLKLAPDKNMDKQFTYMIPVERNNDGFFIDGKESHFKYKVRRGRGDVWEVEKAEEIAKATT